VTIEANFEFRTDEIFIKFIPPSGFTLGIIELKKEFFETYEIEKEYTITVDTTLLYKIIKKLGKKEINIELLRNGGLIKCSSGKSFFELRTYTVPKDERPVPNVEYESIWNIDSNEFSNLIQEHLEFSTVANFKSENDELRALMKSDLISGEILTSAKCILQNDVNCYYDIEILSVILGIKNIFKNIEYSFGNNLPCRIKGTNEELNFTWILAPRIAGE